MLAGCIARLERRCPLYNRTEMGLADTLQFALNLGIKTFSDSTEKTAVALNFNGRSFILYNPGLPERELVMVLGHEIGHHMLGHCIGPSRRRFSRRSLWRNVGGYEQDATMVGICCVIPSIVVDFCEKAYPRPKAETLWWYMTPWDEEIDLELAREMCRIRLRLREEAMV